MATKEFHYRKGDREMNVSIEYRMPTRQEFLSISGIISLLSGVFFLVKALILDDKSLD
ncbi:hypothetical protein [Alkalibacterium sp. 20]|uniref:hypothetical protein n=1 Tax=Alkalibacterium sp. 20 TaxID=1798803 RepID=UPI000B1340F6|nr:hypothetical protein [Alkalibacterium sp. 20]